MYNSANFNAPLIKAIDDEKGRSGNDQLAKIAVARARRELRKALEKAHGVKNAPPDASRSNRTARTYEGDRIIKFSLGAFGPDDPHQPSLS